MVRVRFPVTACFEINVYICITVGNQIIKRGTLSQIYLILLVKNESLFLRSNSLIVIKHCCNRTKDVIFQWKRRYQIQCARRVSGITFIRYAQCLNIWEQEKQYSPSRIKVTHVSLLFYVFGSTRYSNIHTHLGGVSDFSMFVLLVLFSYLYVLFTRISLRTSTPYVVCTNYFRIRVAFFSHPHLRTLSLSIYAGIFVVY